MFDSAQFGKDADKVLEVVAGDMATVKTGRAKPSLIENVSVEAYGTRMKLLELANISVPDPAMLVVSPWDKGNLSAIEKGIASAGLNINPIVEGDHIRIAIPALTQERRLEMVKLVKQKTETGKQMLRDVRQKHKKLIDDQKGKPGVSEDTIASELKTLQDTFDMYGTKLESMAQDKEKELMAI